jgi:hypothetical protein
MRPRSRRPAGNVSVAGLLRMIKFFLSRFFSFRVMTVVLLIAGIFFCCLHRNILSDPDIWWHLRNAQYLVSGHSFLRQDIYSSTIYGKPWPNPEWLSEIPYFLAWKWFGLRGIYVLAVTMVEALALGVWALAWQRTRNTKPAVLASCTFLIMATVSLGPRTQMFGWLCLIVELTIFEQYRQGKNHLWLLPVVFAAWINLHGSWPVGVVFFGIYVFCGLFERRWGSIATAPWTASQRDKVLLAFVFSLAALMVNPYGWRLIEYPVQIMIEHRRTIDTINEWQTLNFHGFRGKLVFAMLTALLLSSMARKRIWDLVDLLQLLIATLAAFTYTRFLLLEGIVLAPLLARELNCFADYRKEMDKPILNLSIVAIAVAFICTHIPAEDRLRVQADEGYPRQAVQFFRSSHLEGKLFNDYNWGGYLIWNLPGTKVFIDSNAEAFDKWGIFADYMDAMQIRQPLRILDQYRIDYVLLPRAEPLSSLLMHTAGWAVKYDDGSALILQRAAR